MKSILFTLSNKMDEFSKSEQLVAQFIMDNPKEISGLNADEMAKSVGVSAATVVRLAKKVCDDGLPGLKMRLAAEGLVDEGLFAEIDPTDSLDVLKNKMEYRISSTIEKTNQTLKIESIKQAANIINQVHTVFAYGVGASHLVAEDLQQKFIRVGKPVAQTLDSHLLAIGLLKEDAVLVLVSNSGESSESIKLANTARELDIPIITITQAINSTLAKKSSVVLLHEDSGEGTAMRSAATTSLMAQLYVVDLLYYAYLRSDFDDNLERLAKSHDVIRTNFNK